MSEQSAFLAFYLDAPMQSWGYQSRFDRRTTLGYPTRSGVFGMICAAMGVDWSETQEALVQWRDVDMTVLVFQQGGRLWDYHTVGGGYNKEAQASHIVPSAEGKPRGTVLTNREYLENSRFGVVLAGSKSLLREIETHMNNPRWGIWLGRKACIPASRVCEGVYEDEAEAEAALSRAAQCRAISRRIREVRDFAEGTDTLMDRPLDFKKRDFAPRRVKVDTVDAESFNGLVLGESSLASDWLSKEEDEAWKDL